MFRSVRKPFQTVTLKVDALEERCTPAVLVTPIQPPLLVQLGQNPAPLVRTDLFCGGHEHAAPADDLVVVQGAFTALATGVDLQTAHKGEAEPTAHSVTPDWTDDAPTRAYAAEPITLCVVVEYD